MRFVSEAAEVKIAIEVVLFLVEAAAAVLSVEVVVVEVISEVELTVGKESGFD